MPNHVTNEIVVVGSELEITAVKRFMKSEENPFDFNKLIKIPKILEGTRSPSKIITKKEYDRQELIITIFESHNSLKDEDLIKAINNDLDIPLTIEEENEVKHYKFHGYSRGLTKKLQEQTFNKYGADNWYDWYRNAWGTKWNSYSHYGFEDETNPSFGFETAWSHPFPIIEALSKRFPNTQFDIRYADEDTGHNVGEYSILNCEIILSNIPEGGSDEAYELAIDINGCDWELYDVFMEISEEDSFDNYEEVCLRLAIKNETLDEAIPTWVLEKALEQCVDSENYEYADKLKGFIALAEK